MSLWGNVAANSSLEPKFKILATSNAIGNAIYANVTVAAFINNESVGLFGVDSANALASNIYSTPGWVVVHHGTGPVVSYTATGGTGFANGETFYVSGGTVNATGNLTSNATSNLSSATLKLSGAGFSNASTLTVHFNREQHLANVTVTGTTSGYSNTDVVTASNGTINATATVSTNATGGITNSSFTITNIGLFGNTLANSAVVVAIANSTGGNSAGTGATFAAGLTTSSGGTVTPTLGGRANRIMVDTLVAMASMKGDANTTLPSQ